ncbi:HlyD family efflux transporter periplasmic adaptor subunit [Allofournierella sp.]|uniref:HlyD family efflux transporter periplasmic adaptor subunit n=1 Tax=Allofournierella sp. TaxID=1940256 RepID=UPI003AB68CEA
MRSSKHKIATFAILLVLAVPVLYLAKQLFAILDRPYQTETAIEYDLSDSLLCEGYLAFDQAEVPGGGLLGYLVENGERVAQNGQVAEQYTDESQGRARQRLTELDAQIELLKKSENTAGSDVDLLLTQRQSSFYDLLDQLDSQNYQGVTRQANAYLLAVNRLQITTGATRDFSAARSLLEEERQAALAQLGSPAPVTAPSGGYFVAAAAGEWLEYDVDQLDAMGAAEIADALESGAGVRAMSGAGKLVGSYKWRFYGVCTLQESKKFENVSKVNLSFPGEAEKVLPAKVESVTVDEASGLAKVVLSCEYVGADVLSLARGSAKIDFESYQGVRINAKALHIVDGEKGVYVKYGNLARWRRITVLYQNEEYILVPEGGKVGTENEVRLFDEVIVEGSDLRDGKML